MQYEDIEKGWEDCKRENFNLSLQKMLQFDHHLIVPVFSRDAFLRFLRNARIFNIDRGISEGVAFSNDI